MSLPYLLILCKDSPSYSYFWLQILIFILLGGGPERLNLNILFKEVTHLVKPNRILWGIYTLPVTENNGIKTK